MRTSQKLKITASTPVNFLESTPYDFSKWNLGSGILKNTDGSNAYLAPIFKMIRPLEESVPFAAMMPFVINFSEIIDYVFLIENSVAASAIRRVRMYTVNKQTGVVTANGFTNITLPIATAHTVRDFKIDRKIETTGTVQVAGTAITGTGTLFNTNKVAVGARIGFGSTDPKLIATWYQITAKASDTGATIALSAGTITAGTPYVIEEYRPVLIMTNATTTNGGVYIAKGVSPMDMTNTGTTIAAGTTLDDVKAAYWLKDAASQTNIIAAGAYLDTEISPLQRDLYVMDIPAAGLARVYKYNIRASLGTITAGSSVSTITLLTGNQAFTGTGSQNANLAGCTALHGAGSGIKSLYFVTSTRIYRAAIANITSGNVNWISDNISELTPGGANTYPVTNALSSINYNDRNDAFNILTTGSAFNYFTKYVTSGQQFSKNYGRNLLNLESSVSDLNNPLHINLQASFSNSHDSGNFVYFCKQSTVANANHLYVTAFGADWDYASVNGNSGYAISPSILIVDASNFLELLVQNKKEVGTGQFTKPTEPFRLYFRTANITTDATTGWTLLNEISDLSGFAGAAQCQIKIEWKTMGEFCIPARIFSLDVAYNNKLMSNNWVASDEKSVSANKEFAFRQSIQYGSNYPTLTIELTDSLTNTVLVTSLSATQLNGVWQKSTDGTTWTAFNNIDRVAGVPGDNTFIRFTPTAALTGKIKATLY